jgi:hypothetical protein
MNQQQTSTNLGFGAFGRGGRGGREGTITIIVGMPAGKPLVDRLNGKFMSAFRDFFLNTLKGEKSGEIG